MRPLAVTLMLILAGPVEPSAGRATYRLQETWLTADGQSAEVLVEIGAGTTLSYRQLTRIDLPDGRIRSRAAVWWVGQEVPCLVASDGSLPVGRVLALPARLQGLLGTNRPSARATATGVISFDLTRDATGRPIRAAWVDTSPGSKNPIRYTTVTYGDFSAELPPPPRNRQACQVDAGVPRSIFDIGTQPDRTGP